MKIETLIKLRSNINNVNYIRENSNWYKYLNRSDNCFKDFESEMKEKYKITPEERLKKLEDSLDSVSKIMDILN